MRPVCKLMPYSTYTLAMRVRDRIRRQGGGERVIAVCEDCKKYHLYEELFDYDFARELSRLAEARPSRKQRANRQGHGRDDKKGDVVPFPDRKSLSSGSE